MAVDGQRFMTKTQHYRKVTKPLLERKRRARMNLYLDELKDLIVDTMEAQGEHVTKLEKADILEMTVTYLKTRKHEIATNAATTQTYNGEAHGINNVTAGGGAGAGAGAGINVEKFRAGYTQAAYEVSKVFATLPGLDLKFGTRLMKHLGYQLKDLKQQPTSSRESCGSASDSDDVEFVKPIGYPPQQRRAAEKPLSLAPPAKELAAQAKDDDVWRPW